MIHDLDLVALACDFPEIGLKTGDVGTVVLLHDGSGYEVEFLTFGGDTVAVVALKENQVRPVGPREIHHARPLEPLP